MKVEYWFNNIHYITKNGKKQLLMDKKYPLKIKCPDQLLPEHYESHIRSVIEIKSPICWKMEKRTIGAGSFNIEFGTNIVYININNKIETNGKLCENHQ